MAETEPPLWADLPDIKLEGYTFNILEAKAADSTGVTVPQGAVEELTGDVINDEVYRRNQAVSDRFGVKINTLADTAANVTTVVVNLIQSNDDAYQLIIMSPAAMQRIALNNSFYNLYDIEHIDLTKLWYNQQQVEDYTIKNKLYWWVGDFAYATALFGGAIVYNTTLAEQLQLPDIYDLVLSGKWTLDEMNAHTASVSADLNGDTQYLEADDRFAFIATGGANMMNFQYCCGETFIQYDAASDKFVDVFNLEKMEKLVDKLKVLYSQDNRTCVAKDRVSLFQSGRALMSTMYLGTLFEHRDMENNFTPIPYPKYDEAQESYLSLMSASSLTMGIPKTVQDTASAGLVVEAMSEYSAGALKDAVYERVLSYQTLRDERSMDVLKLITDGLIVDFGYLTDTKNHVRRIIGTVLDKDTSLASAYESKRSTVEAFYADLLKSYENLT